MYKKKKKHKGGRCKLGCHFPMADVAIVGTKKKRKEKKILGHTKEECEQICSSLELTYGIKIHKMWR